MRPSRLPSAMAAWTKSRSRIESTSPRTTRAYTTQEETPMTMMMFWRLGPSTPITAMARRMKGEAGGAARAAPREGGEEEGEGDRVAPQPHEEVVHAPPEVARHEPDGHAE